MRVASSTGCELNKYTMSCELRVEEIVEQQKLLILSNKQRMHSFPFIRTYLYKYFEAEMRLWDVI